MTIKTIEQVSQDMQIFTEEEFPTALTTPGAAASFLSDVMIGAPKSEIANELGEINYTQLSASFAGFVTMSTDATIRAQLMITFGYTTEEQLDVRLTTDLNKLAKDYKNSRDPGFAAATVVTYQFGTGAVVTIAAGHTVRTRSATPIKYTALQTITLSPVLRTTGVYILPIPVQCTQIGVVGDTGSGTILDFDGGVAGLVAVINDADVNNGLDPETNAVFAQRMEDIQLQGFALDTRNGLRAEFLSFGVPDVAIIAANDPNTTRFFGVDAWILLDEPSIAVDQIVWAASYSALGYKPIHQPVHAATTGFALSGFANAVLTTVKEAVINPDAYSELAQDRIVITFPTGPAPNIGDQLGLAYIYNGGISRIQQKLTDPNIQLFAEILVKEAILRPIQLTMPFNLTPGFNPAQVVQLVTAGLQAKVSSLLLGQELNLSDLITITAQTPGVQRVLVDQISFNFTDNPVKDSSGSPLQFVDSLTVTYNQYIRYTSSGLIVQVVT